MPPSASDLPLHPSATTHREPRSWLGDTRASAQVIWRHALLTWLALLLNAAGYLTEVRILGPATLGYVALVFVGYTALYVTMLVVPLALLSRVAALARLLPRGAALVRGLRALLIGLLLLLTIGLQVFIFADVRLFQLYGFHMNGFVWNLIQTPGGIASMDASLSSAWIVGGVVLAITVAQLLLFRLARTNAWLRRRSEVWLRPRRMTAGWLSLVAVTALHLGAFAYSDATGYRPVTSAAMLMPFAARPRIPGFAHRHGLTAGHDDLLAAQADRIHLDYPKAPLARAPEAPDLNIVWLVAESLRWDMLTDEIMPATSAFARRAIDCRNHYSGGNGTRMGMFSMFYGLYGSYWFRFLDETAEPVLMRLLAEAGYDMEARTSARFSFPEFDKTIFARLPRERLYEGDPELPGWQNDRANVAALLQSIDQRPADRPFFRFMFFESSHSRYIFPPEAIIRPDYLVDFHYTTMDVERDALLLKNRYINACHHLDQQIGRVLEQLQQSGLLESTLVVITGDHGEEFMEKGRWGHHSTFSEEQTRSPLVLWVPGVAARRIEGFTSHLDIVPTIMARLGVTNPADDYSLGRDILGPGARDHCVVADWDRLAWVGPEVKLILPLKSEDIGREAVTTRDDVEVLDSEPVFAAHTADMAAMLQAMTRFVR